MSGPLVRRLCLIGVGLIGGSWARALRGAGQVGRIVGCGRNQENLERAAALGVVDAWTTDPAEAVREADLVVVAVPLGAMRSVFRQIAPALAPDAVVTDVGSAKASVIADARAELGEHLAGFVPGHPIAGTEQSGVEASFPDLYRGRRVILTPLEDTREAAVERVRAAWQVTGATVSTMSARHHDEVLAATSHLPHVLAYGLVDSLSRWSDRDEIFQYAAGGFRDFTRIASSDPTMWRDICLANHASLTEVLERYTADLQALTEVVRARDGEQLKAVFQNAQQARERFLALLEG